jgi:hypothetical protein
VVLVRPGLERDELQRQFDVNFPQVAVNADSSGMGSISTKRRTIDAVRP